MKELNEGAPQKHKLSEEILESLERLLMAVCGPNSSEAPPNLQQINLLWKASHWPEGTATALFYCYYLYVYYKNRTISMYKVL